ncbi:MAG: hypothetical protein IIA89_14185 [Chloroflexi bacterium]|nr:hypothetical protein [Chloroflexota bacterium]
MQRDAETLTLLSLVLVKPVGYFYPDRYGESLRLDKLSDEKQELLMQARALDSGDLKRLIAQAKALADVSRKI